MSWNVQKRPGLFVILIALVLLGGIAGYFYLAKPDEETIHHLRNQGVADMERFEYNDAAKRFSEALELSPKNTEIRLNLGIAQLNQATDASLAQAIKQFQIVLGMEPNNIKAHYCLGLIAFHQNRTGDAAREFAWVLDKDPNDAYAWSWFAKVHPDGDDSPKAFEALKRAMELDPYLNAARYALALHPLMEDPVLRKRLLDDHERLKQADWERNQDLVYTQMGPYASVTGAYQAAHSSSKALLPQFLSGEPGPTDLGQGEDGTKVQWAGKAVWPKTAENQLLLKVRDQVGVCFCLGDFAQTGRLGAFLGGAVLRNNTISDLLLIQEEPGKWVAAPLPLPKGWVSWAASASDLDNDGITDLVLSGPAGIRTLRNLGNAKFVDQTPDLPAFKRLTLGIRAVDIDQDGDLDLVGASPGNNVAEAMLTLSGNGQAGSLFALLNSGEAPATPPGKALLPLTWVWKETSETLLPKILGAMHLILADVDNDGDLDLVVFAHGLKPQMVFNDRLLRFSGPMAFGNEGFHPSSGLTADINNDGIPDMILTGSDHQPHLFLVRPQSTAGKPVLEAMQSQGPSIIQAIACDIDNNGLVDLLGLIPTGRMGLARNYSGVLEFDPQGLQSNQTWPKGILGFAMADNSGDGKVDMWLWHAELGLEVRQNKGNGNQAISILATGKRDKGDTLRTNSDGIGARIQAVAGTLRGTVDLATLNSGPSHSSIPVMIGLGRALAADTVSIRWPDRVVQAEKNLATGEIHKISETNRKATSCPILMWQTPTGMRMVTDLLGGGAMGEQNTDGSIRPPRPTESLWVVPPEPLVKGDTVRFSLSEPMDEVMYLDRVRLEAVDLPLGWEAAPDERFVFSGPQPTGDLLLFPQLFPLQKAKKLDGRDCLAELSKADGSFPRDYPLRSWLGFAGEHGWEFTFATPAQKNLSGPQSNSPQVSNGVDANDRFFLILDAWTDYAYPESLFASNQAGVEPIIPAIEIPDGKGGWKKAMEIGVPAGLPKRMTIEVTSLGKSLHGPMRIRTNLRIGIDRIQMGRLARKEEKAPIRSMALRSAVLENPGLFREVPGPDGIISYDHSKRERPGMASLWKGNFTRTGPVEELLTHLDDLLMIGGPGDEVTFEFASGGPVPKGFTRGYFLRVEGYCRDTSPTTKGGGFVEPWPFAAMGDFPEGKPHPKASRMLPWTTRSPKAP